MLKKNIKTRGSISTIKRFFIQHKFLLSIMLIAACARFILLGSLPDGVYPDEAYNAYNTWSMMVEGIDSRGYHAPVYFIAWGSGMNVLYAYLALPFFRLFGASLFVFRLPQALVSLAGVAAFYVLGRECFDKATGYLMAFALAINPWSIMNARFGLESTLAPYMILFTLTFFVLGLKKKANYLYLSAVFMAASLYSYSLTWIALPIILILVLLLYWKSIPFKPVTFISAFMLLLAAVPLLLFLAVNLGYLPEITTPFLSIPKLEAFRSSELSLQNLLGNITTVLDTLTRQYDNHAHTASPITGAYYLFTTPFFLLGIILHIGKLIKKHNHGNNELQYIFCVWLVSALIVALLQTTVTMTHINLIHIPVIFYGIYGIIQTARYTRCHVIVPACVFFFSISFIVFFYNYATSVDTHFYNTDVIEALEEAQELAAPDQTITIVGYQTIQCGAWMWYERPLPSDFCANVTYIDDPAWGQIGTYGQYEYVFSIDMITKEDIYICPNSKAFYEILTDMDLTIIQLNERYLIAYSSVP